MELKDTHEQVGSIGYTVIDDTPVGKIVHLGHFTYKKFWGNGYTVSRLDVGSVVFCFWHCKQAFVTWFDI